MANYSDQEVELQSIVAVASKSSSTGPWGPTGKALAKQGETSEARAIGIQDSTVIDRAIGSPGMKKPLKIHGFVVLQPGPERKPAEQEDVLKRLRQSIETEPNISTAVVMPYWNDFYPSHILSSDEHMQARLHGVYPNAELIGDLEKSSQTAGTPVGPWNLTIDEVIRGSDQTVMLRVDDPEAELRVLHPGDAVVLVHGGAEAPWALARVHHVRPGPDEFGFLVVLDRFAELDPAPIEESVQEVQA